MSTSKLDDETHEFLQRELLCRRCNERTPVHMLWFKVLVSQYQRTTVAQAVCDPCLEAAAASLSAARAMRVRLGEKCTLIAVATL